MTDKLEFVTCCGLYCELCAERARIPRQAAALQHAMTEEGWHYWGHTVPGFTEFWQFLEGLHTKGGCPGCRAGGGFPQCQIRVCAREQSLELCSQCSNFPCHHIEALDARYPTLIADNRRLQVVGLEQWLDEQRERARRGVVYADLRYQEQALLADEVRRLEGFLGGEYLPPRFRTSFTRALERQTV